MKQKTKHIIVLVLLIALISALYVLKNTNLFVRLAGFLISVLFFYLLDSYFKLKFKPIHYIIYILIVTTGILLSPLYFISTMYDKILHLIIPIFVAMLVFHLTNKLKIKFYQKILITFCITISILALFEIGEFILDKLFGWKLQGVYLRDMTGLDKLNIVMDKNDDTMMDLILGTLGTIIFTLVKTTNYCFSNECKIKTKK